jgi:hypothetical protein
MSLRAILARGNVEVATVARAGTGAEALRRTMTNLSREQFELRGPAFWLIRPLESHERGPALYRTQPDAIRPVATSPLREGEPLAPRLRIDPAGFACHPLAKGSASPWRDRILLGRAANNDVVMRDKWISKLHAWFELAEDDLFLCDAQSQNGTWVDGVRLEPDNRVVIESGTRLRFGHVSCEVLGSGALFDALS